MFSYLILEFLKLDSSMQSVAKVWTNSGSNSGMFSGLPFRLHVQTGT
jgi:hypothetical protein